MVSRQFLTAGGAVIGEAPGSIRSGSGRGAWAAVVAVLAAACTSFPATTAAPAPATDEVAGPVATPAAPATQTGGSPQQRDYSPQGLFEERHLGFLNRAERYEPSIFARFALMPDATISGESGSFDMVELRVRGDQRFAVDPNAYLSAGGEFRHRKYDVSSNVTGFRDEDVYALGLRLGFGVFASDDLLVEGMFRPGLYTDFDGALTSKDWKWFGHGLATYRAREELFFKVGAAVSEDFRDVNLIPLAGLAWLINDQWRVDLLLPHLFETSFSPDGGITTLSLGLYLEGDQYRIRGPAVLGKPRTDIQTQEIVLALGGTHRLNENLSAFVQVGSVVAGDYKLRQGGAQQYDGSLDPSFYVHAGVGLDF